VRVEAKLMLCLGAFFGAIGLLYWLWGTEDGGGVMLLGATLLGFLPGSYYYWWSRRMKPRAEDLPDADVADGAGVIATFPGSSIFPFLLGMGAFCSVLAMVFGIWLLVPGLGLVFWALVGASAESRHGGEH
jgi:hypothetical protein